MILRKTNLNNIPSIMAIISDAQSYLKSLGIDQWQDGYPDEAQISLDIKNDDSYVISNDDNQVMGTVVFTTSPESTYDKIDGEWKTKSNVPYGVIHRLAVSNNYRGVGIAKFVFEFCERQLKEMGVQSMRIDTHRDNKGMQQLILGLGYEYCGVIILNSGAERLAYEKLIV